MEFMKKFKSLSGISDFELKGNNDYKLTNELLKFIEIKIYQEKEIEIDKIIQIISFVMKEKEIDNYIIKFYHFLYFLYEKNSGLLYRMIDYLNEFNETQFEEFYIFSNIRMMENDEDFILLREKMIISKIVIESIFKSCYPNLEKVVHSLHQKIVKFFTYHYSLFCQYSLINLICFNDCYNIMYYLFFNQKLINFSAKYYYLYLSEEKGKNISKFISIHNQLNSLQSNKPNLTLLNFEEIIKLLKSNSPNKEKSCFISDKLFDTLKDPFKDQGVLLKGTINLTTDNNKYISHVINRKMGKLKCFFDFDKMQIDKKQSDKIMIEMIGNFSDEIMNYIGEKDKILFIESNYFKFHFEIKKEKLNIKVECSEIYDFENNKLFENILNKLFKNVFALGNCQKIKFNLDCFCKIDLEFLKLLIYPKNNIKNSYSLFINCLNCKLICHIKVNSTAYTIYSDLKYYLYLFNNLVIDSYESNLIDEGYKSENEIIFPTLPKDLTKKFVNKKLSKKINYFLISKVTFQQIYLLKKLKIEEMIKYIMIKGYQNFMIFFEEFELTENLISVFCKEDKFKVCHNGFIFSFSDLENLEKFNSNMEFIKFESFLVFNYTFQFFKQIDIKILMSINLSFFSSKIFYLFISSLFQFSATLYFKGNKISVIFSNLERKRFFHKDLDQYMNKFKNFYREEFIPMIDKLSSSSIKNYSFFFKNDIIFNNSNSLITQSIRLDFSPKLKVEVSSCFLGLFFETFYESFFKGIRYDLKIHFEKCNCWNIYFIKNLSEFPSLLINKFIISLKGSENLFEKQLEKEGISILKVSMLPYFKTNSLVFKIKSSKIESFINIIHCLDLIISKKIIISFKVDIDIFSEIKKHILNSFINKNNFEINNNFKILILRLKVSTNMSFFLFKQLSVLKDLIKSKLRVNCQIEIHFSVISKENSDSDSDPEEINQIISKALENIKSITEKSKIHVHYELPLLKLIKQHYLLSKLENKKPIILILSKYLIEKVKFSISFWEKKKLVKNLEILK